MKVTALDSPPSLPASGSSLNQAMIFQQLRWKMLRNTSQVLLRNVARPLTIVACSAVVWIIVYLTMYWGFAFLLDQDPNRGFVNEIVPTLFSLLFLALLVMLLFSSSIILYSSLFGSAEAVFLLSTPARADQIFAYKYQGALSFSSWAFILLGSPVLIAYGVMFDAPWYFFVLMPLFFFGFVLIPGSLGALVCLLVVNYVPKRRKQVVLLAGTVLLIVLGLWIVSLVRHSRTPSWTLDATRNLLSQFSFAQGMMMPSQWISQGLIDARTNLGRSFYYLALIWSNGLFLYVLTAWLSTRLYRRGYNRIATGGALKRRYGGHGLDNFLSALMGFLDPQIRHLIIKDFRTFRRDPAQSAQVLLLVGLLALYFLNTRRFYQEGVAWTWRNGISGLNLTATALLLCAYTGRFIYPLLSLEGRKFWILGLLPLKRDRLLWGKFTFSAIGAVIIAESLVVLSDLMLGMPWLIVILHVLNVIVLAAGLSGLSVGLGACLPNFRETDPSKIAVGFGGTLNLVACVLFLWTSIFFMSMPWHVRAGTVENPESSPPDLDGMMVLGVLVGVAVGVGAVILPLRAGARAMRRMEF